MTTATRPRLGSDDWNAEHRDELPMSRADRNFIELLQELRVAFTGVQILFGFLLTATFSDRFASLDRLQTGVFVTTLLGAVLASVLLIAPVAAHRIAFQRGRKPELVRWGHVMAMSGLSFLGLTIVCGLALVLDLAVGRWAALVAAGVLLVGMALVWAVAPIVRLR